MTAIIRGGCAHDCPDACAWEVTVENGRATGLRGAAHHPYTRGTLCSKVNNYLDRVYSPDRILHPLKRVGAKGAGRFERVGWDEAVAGIAARLEAVIDQYGPEAVLPYSSGGNLGLIQFSSMDRRFFNRLGASRLDRTICGLTAGEGVRAVLGTDTARLAEDVPHARLIVLWGTNTVVTNLHLWPYVRQAREQGAKLVVVDPLRTRTARQADWHVQPLPGTDAALALGMINVIAREGLQDQDYLDRYCEGWPELRDRAAEYPPERVGAICGLDAGVVVRLARMYASKRPAMIRTLIGAEKHAGGGAAFRAIACLPAVVGAWRDRGGGLMHMVSLVGEALNIWWGEWGDAPAAGTRTINMVQIGRALADAAVQPPIAALFVYNSNPASIAPNSGLVRRGLARDDLFCVVHDLFLTDTARVADYVLPATSLIEQLDLLYPYGHHYLVLNQPAIPPQGEAVSNTDLFRRLAVAMGWGDEPQFHETDEQLLRQALAREHPYLAGVDYERLRREGWAPLRIEERGAVFSDGGFPTPSGRCRLAQPELRSAGLDPVPDYVRQHEGSRYPLTMLSAKTALHFLNSSFTMLPRQARREGPAVVEIDPADAAARGIEDGDMVRVFNDRGSIELVARVGDGVRSGVVAIPHGHWSSLAGGAANDLTSDGLADMGGGGDFYDTRVDVARSSGR